MTPPPLYLNSLPSYEYTTVGNNHPIIPTVNITSTILPYHPTSEPPERRYSVSALLTSLTIMNQTHTTYIITWPPFRFSFLFISIYFPLPLCFFFYPHSKLHHWTETLMTIASQLTNISRSVDSVTTARFTAGYASAKLISSSE